MKDRKPTKVLQNGAVQYSVTRVSMGVTATREEWIRPEDEPLESGTPLTKENAIIGRSGGDHMAGEREACKSDRKRRAGQADRSEGSW